MTVSFSLLHGDALELLQQVPKGSVDLVLTDPPYGDTSLDWDRQVGGWLELVGHVLKPSGSVWVFGSLRFLLAQHGAFTGWNYAQDLVWEKHNGSSFHADRFKRVHEHLVQLYPPNARWRDIYKDPVKTLDATKRTTRRKRRPTHTGHIESAPYVSHDGGPKLMRSVIRERSCHGYAIHPTQKPVAILDPIIRYSCPPGGVILDPFAGSGSTGEAAMRLSRNFIGMEVSQEYHAAASARLAAVLASLPNAA